MYTNGHISHRDARAKAASTLTALLHGTGLHSATTPLIRRHLRATIRTIHQLGERIRATRAGEGMPIDQVARHCGVSIGMLSKLENDKGVNLEHALRVMDGLGLAMLVQFAVLIRREVKAWACRSRRQPYNCQSDSILEFVRWPRYSGLDRSSGSMPRLEH